MQHPATGVTWDALDAATGLDAVGPVKGPSIQSTLGRLDQIIGLLQTFDQSDEIPATPRSQCDLACRQIASCLLI